MDEWLISPDGKLSAPHVKARSDEELRGMALAAAVAIGVVVVLFIALPLAYVFTR